MGCFHAATRFRLTTLASACAALWGSHACPNDCRHARAVEGKRIELSPNSCPGTVTVVATSAFALCGIWHKRQRQIEQHIGHNASSLLQGHTCTPRPHCQGASCLLVRIYPVTAPSTNRHPTKKSAQRTSKMIKKASRVDQAGLSAAAMGRVPTPQQWDPTYQSAICEEHLHASVATHE